MSEPWPKVPLAEVLTHRSDFITIDDTKTYKRCRVQVNAQGVVLRDKLEGAAIKTKSQQICQVGEFLVAEIDAKMGGFGIVPPELDGAIVSSHYFLFGIDEPQLDRRFLDYYIRTHDFRGQVEAQGSTNYAAIRPAHVLSYRVPLPPLPEQRRIVSRVEELTKRIRAAKELHQLAQREREALRNSVANALFDPARLSQFPVHKLGEVADVQAGVTLGRTLTGSTVSLPYLRVANVQDGHLDLRKIKEVDVLETEAEKWLLTKGDILLTEGGDWDKLGRGTVWAEEIPRCIHQNHIFRVRVPPDRFDPYFLAAYIGSPHGKLYFQLSAKKTTNLASINQQQLNTSFQEKMY